MNPTTLSIGQMYTYRANGYVMEVEYTGSFLNCEGLDGWHDFLVKSSTQAKRRNMPGVCMAKEETDIEIITISGAAIGGQLKPLQPSRGEAPERVEKVPPTGDRGLSPVYMASGTDLNLNPETVAEQVTVSSQQFTKGAVPPAGDRGPNSPETAGAVTGELRIKRTRKPFSGDSLEDVLRKIYVFLNRQYRGGDNDMIVTIAGASFYWGPKMAAACFDKRAMTAASFFEKSCRVMSVS